VGSYYKHNVSFNIDPPPPSGTQVGLSQSPLPLLWEGFTFPVTVSTPSGRLQNPKFNKESASSMAVMAHLDTGASRTSIDIRLACYLGLKSTGMADNLTAAGLKTMPNFVIDLYFQNTDLSPFINLPVSSCNLSFDISGNRKDPKNFAVLLGRDVLARWNVVWNGPTSTVFIND
jgi:hypothetical protein